MTESEVNALKVGDIVYYRQIKLKVIKKVFSWELDLFCEIIESDSETYYVSWKTYFIKDLVEFEPYENDGSQRKKIMKEEKKRAIELLEKFKPYANDVDGSSFDYQKECALIVVSEVIHCLQKEGMHHWGWDFIKREINDLDDFGYVELTKKNMNKTIEEKKILVPDLELIEFAKEFSENYLKYDFGEYFSKNKKYHVKWTNVSGAKARVGMVSGTIELDKTELSSWMYAPEFIFALIIWCGIRFQNGFESVLDGDSIKHVDKMVVDYYLTTERSKYNLIIGWINVFKTNPSKLNEERLELITEQIGFHSSDETEKETLKDKILNEFEKGNICIMDSEGLKAMPIKTFIEQPVEGMLYDLNRSEPVVLTFIDDPKWVNDFAVAKTIRALKERIEELEEQILFCR